MRRRGHVPRKWKGCVSGGVVLLGSAAIGYWVSPAIGIVLAGMVGALILQSAFTNWCLADLFLRPMGLKPKLESKRTARRANPGLG
jgi:hypothetical protein